MNVNRREPDSGWNPGRLAPGDVLSYSAGSTQTGPYGFRKIRRQPARGSLLAESIRRWPDLSEFLGDRTVLFVNAYPAAGFLDSAVTVDTYLSPRVLTRALKLGKAGGHPTIVLAQPLFLADALLRHVGAGHALPETLLAWVGGYAMPRSLEQMLESLLASHVPSFLAVHYFGAAEVDSGCMMARERDAGGELVYYPREDVEPSLDGDRLLLTLRTGDGEPIVERFATGDRARRSGDGWAIRNPDRLHPDVEAELESWSEADWKRRTGYVRRDGGEIRIQLREGEIPRRATELDHYDFARCFGFSWLEKPYWK